MEGKDRNKFAEVMWALAEDFGGKISEPSLKHRFIALQEYSIDQITQAGTWILKHREKDFPPVPTTKEIIDAIENLDNPKISTKAVAESQVDIVLKTLKYYGQCWKNGFKDPITNHLMSVRWPYISWACTVLEKDLVWFRKEFINAYETYQKCADKGFALIDAPESFKLLANNSVKRIEG